MVGETGTGGTGRTCARCGAHVGIGDAFCMRCGSRLDEAREGEGPGRTAPECGAEAAAAARRAAREAADRAVADARARAYGADAGARHAQAAAAQVEPWPKLACELAYTGWLFWLPLVAGAVDASEARRHANRGLWALVVAMVACWAIQLLGSLKDMLAGPGVAHVLADGAYMLATAALVAFLAFLTFRCVQEALHVHRGEASGGMLFFDRLVVIRSGEGR